ncbi:MAG: carboxypeptidase regulatory-like domain-containing protein [Planctomycetes bacterium]|nr:carboxypeptidase regulatory-like domain-containing protein [Planctomycetota bacterium]
MRADRLVVGGIAVVMIAAIATWWLPDSAEPAPLPPTDVGERPAPTDEVDTEPTASVAANPVVRHDVAPDESSIPTAFDDPDFRRGLTTITGTVLRSGKPVAGANVTVVRPGEFHRLVAESRLARTFVARGVTSADGKFRVESVWPSLRNIRFEVRASAADGATGSVTKQRSLPIGNPVDVGTIELGATTSVSGRVLDSSGSPRAGVRVRAVAGDVIDDPESWVIIPSHLVVRSHRCTPAGPTTADRMFEQTTDAAGRFKIESCATDVYTVMACVDGNRPSAIWSGHPDAEPPGDMTLGDGTLRGRVFDAAGSPVAGAQLLVSFGHQIPKPPWAFESDRAPAFLAHPAGPATDDGSFRITGLPDGEIHVAVRAGPDRGWTVFPSLDRDQEHELHLVRETDATFRVVAEPPRAAPDNYAIWIGPLTSREIDRLGRSFHEFSVSDFAFSPSPNRIERSPGQLVVRGLPYGRYWLAAEGDGLGAFVQFSHSLGEPIDLVFDRTPTIVRVVDIEDRAIRNARVLVRPETPVAPGTQRIVGMTDKAGEVAFLPMAREQVEVLVEHPGFAPFRGKFAIDDHEVDVVLHRTGWVRGRIDYPDRAKIARPHVEHRTSDFSIPIPYSTSGEFWLGQVPAGDYDISTNHEPDSWSFSPSSFHVEANRDNVVVILAERLDRPDYASLEGRISGPFASDARFSVRVAGVLDAASAHDRSFRVDRVPPGKRGINLFLDGCSTVLETRVVEFQPGEVHTVEFEPRFARIRGTVRTEGLQPYSLSVTSAGGAWSFVRPDGSFQLAVTEYGEIGVSAIDRATRRFARESVAVTSGDTIDLVLDLDRRYAVAWTIDPRAHLLGEVVEGTAEGPENFSLEWVSSLGLVHEAPVLAGRYDVTVSFANGKRARTPRPVVVGANGTCAREILLELTH